MVRLRMQRFGRRNRPFYRISAIDQRTRRDGRVIELLGWFDPMTNKPGVKNVELNVERVKYWLSVGAVPSDTVMDMLAKQGLVDTKQWEADRAYDRKRVAEAKAKADAAAAAAPADPKAKKA